MTGPWETPTRGADSRKVPALWGGAAHRPVSGGAYHLPVPEVFCGSRAGYSEPFWPEEGEGNEASRRILRYLQERVGERLTVERIARDNLMGVSQLEKLLGKSWGCGAIELFSRIKIDAAKQLIRDGQLNMTQIAERLGYSSLYYFSRQFKKAAAMSPSEYAASIRILSEKKPRTDDAENRENFT